MSASEEPVRRRLYLDTMDIGRLAGGAYDDDAGGDAVACLAEMLGRGCGSLALSPLHLYELRRAPTRATERLPELLSSVNAELLWGMPHEVLDAELLAALAAELWGEHAQLTITTFELNGTNLPDFVRELAPLFDAMDSTRQPVTEARVLAQLAARSSRANPQQSLRRMEAAVRAMSRAEIVDGIRAVQDTFGDLITAFPWTRKLAKTLGLTAKELYSMSAGETATAWRNMAHHIQAFTGYEVDPELPEALAEQGALGVVQALVTLVSADAYAELVHRLSVRELPDGASMADVSAQLIFAHVAHKNAIEFAEAFDLQPTEYWDVVARLTPEQTPMIALADAHDDNIKSNMLDRMPEAGDDVDRDHLAYMPFVDVMTVDKRVFPLFEAMSRTCGVAKALRGGTWSRVELAVAGLSSPDGGKSESGPDFAV